MLVLIIVGLLYVFGWIYLAIFLYRFIRPVFRFKKEVAAAILIAFSLFIVISFLMPAELHGGGGFGEIWLKRYEVPNQHGANSTAGNVAGFPAVFYHHWLGFDQNKNVLWDFATLATVPLIYDILLWVTLSLACLRMIYFQRISNLYAEEKLPLWRRTKFLSISVALTLVVLAALFYLGKWAQNFEYEQSLTEKVSVNIGGKVLEVPKYMGDTPPPVWSSGIPLPFMSYGDCLSGCIPSLNQAYFLLDVFIWSSLFYRILVKRSRRNPDKIDGV